MVSSADCRNPLKSVAPNAVNRSLVKLYIHNWNTGLSRIEEYFFNHHSATPFSIMNLKRNLEMAKDQKQKKSGEVQSLHELQPNAAGIDIGATEIYVAVPAGRSTKSVRRFLTFTDDLHEAARWLKDCGIDSIAMESTGVYWIPIFQILDAYGFEVNLVNARHVKNVPGRKTDVKDCQWLQYLHSVGLLRSSFRPDQDVCVIRSIVRHRDNLVKSAASHVQHIHKSLTQMNLQIHNVISDITGVTGMAIMDAIIAGERNPEVLAEHRDPRIKADKQTIVKSLTGDYRLEHLFTLKQALQTWRHYQQMIRECDVEIENYLKEFDSRIDPNEKPLPPPTKKQRKPKGNGPDFDVRAHMYRILGTDLTQIDGVSSLTANVIFTEIGPDLSDFQNAGHFCSWLGLCPNNNISGGKILSSHTRPVSNRAASALRLSANSLWNSKSYLGDYFRRMRSRQGAPKAITATAHKLARIIYHLIKNKTTFNASVFVEEENKHQQRLKKRLINQAKSLGLQLMPA
jgi:transposase